MCLGQHIQLEVSCLSEGPSKLQVVLYRNLLCWDKKLLTSHVITSCPSAPQWQIVGGWNLWRDFFGLECYTWRSCLKWNLKHAYIYKEMLGNLPKGFFSGDGEVVHSVKCWLFQIWKPEFRSSAPKMQLTSRIPAPGRLRQEHPWVLLAS